MWQATGLARALAAPAPKANAPVPLPAAAHSTLVATVEANGGLQVMVIEIQR